MTSFSSCVSLYSDDPLYYDHIEVVTTGRAADVYTIVTYGTPHYVEGKLIYYLHNNLYYYPYFYENYWYFRAFRHPFDRLDRIPPFKPRKDDFRFAPGVYKGFNNPNHAILDIRTNDRNRPFRFERTDPGRVPNVLPPNNSRVTPPNNGRVLPPNNGNVRVTPPNNGQVILPNNRDVRVTPPNNTNNGNVRVTPPTNSLNINNNQNRTIINVPRQTTTPQQQNSRSSIVVPQNQNNTRVTIPQVRTTTPQNTNSGARININTSTSRRTSAVNSRR